MVRVLWLQIVSYVCHIWLWVLHTAYDRYRRREWRQGRAALGYDLWRRR